MADDSFVQFLTDLAIEYYQKPKEEGKRLEKERPNQLTNPYSHKWFGFLPSTIKQLKKSGKNHKSSDGNQEI